MPDSSASRRRRSAISSVVGVAALQDRPTGVTTDATGCLHTGGVVRSALRATTSGSGLSISTVRHSHCTVPGVLENMGKAVTEGAGHAAPLQAQRSWR